MSGDPHPATEAAAGAAPTHEAAAASLSDRGWPASSSLMVATPQARIRPPRARPDEVVRTTRLAAVEDSKMLVIAAAGGFGKTTFARQWAEHDSSRALVWLTASEGDADPVVFIAALSAALTAAEVGFAAPADMMVSDEPLFSRWVLPGLLAAIESCRDDFTLVIDDVHLVGSEPTRRVVAGLVEVLPMGCRLALVGRPSGALKRLPVARWQIQARVEVLGAVDLAFDCEELGRLFGDLHSPITASRLAEIMDRTRGWPVAVAFVGQGKSPAQVPELGGIEDYLDAEILRFLDEATLEFLSGCALLPIVTEGLCRSALERPDARERLAQLTELIPMVVEIDDAQLWWRIHPLLQQHLARRVAADRPVWAAEIHARASSWLTEQGYVADAMRSAALSADEAVLDSTVWHHAVPALVRARVGSVQSWLSLTTPDVLARNPGLAMTTAWVHLMQGEAVVARRWAASCRKALLAQPDYPDPTVNAALQIFRSVGGQMGFADAASVAAAATEALPATHGLAPLGRLVVGVMAVLSDGPGAGLTDIVSARRWATSLDVPVVWADAIGLEAMVRIVAGQDDSVDALLVEADHLRRANIRLESTNARLWLAPASAVRAASSGDVELARVRIDEAVQLVVAVEPLIPWAAPLALGLSARARALIGDVSAAGSELAKAEAALGRVPPSPFLERSLAIASEEVVRARSLHDLTPTELTVCDLLTTRATLAEIAQELHVSRETVKSHTSAIYRKFGVSSRRELQDELGEIPRSG